MIVDEKQYAEWMMRMGYRKSDAQACARRFIEWKAQQASQPRARFLKVESWQNWEREFKAFIDRMPRKPTRFLAMVAAAEKRREALARVADRKAVRRRRYQRAHQQQVTVSGE
jgi:hypothetical protein